MPDLVRSFRKAHPRVRFDLTQVRDELVDSVLANADADLVLSSVRPSDPTVERRRLIDQPLRLAVPTDHPLAGQSEVRLADAASEPFLMLHRTSLLRRVCDELCHAAGFAPFVSFEGEDVHTIRSFVAAGLGVAIIPAPGSGSTDVAPGIVRYLTITDVHAVREIGLAWSAQRRLLPATELFRQHVLHRARTQQFPTLA